MRLLALLVLFVCALSRAAAPDTEPDLSLTPEERAIITAEDAKELELALRVQRLLFQLDLELERRHPERFSNEDWEAIVRKSADDIVNAYVPAGLDPVKQSKVRAFLKAMNWKAIGRQLKAAWQWGMGMARAHGILFAGCQLVGTALGFIIPAAVAAAGMPVLGGILFPIPMSDVLTVVGMGTKHYLLKRKLRKLYGKEKFESMNESMRIANQALALRAKNDYLFPVDAGRLTEGIVISDWAPHTRLAEKLGLSRERITYWSLKDFLKENGYDDPFLEPLEKNEIYSAKDKALLLLSHLVRTGRPELIEKLRERYSHAFTLLDHQPSAAKVLGWARSFRDVRTLEQARARLLEAPKGVPAYVIGRVWHQEILPSLQEKLEDVAWWKANRLDTRFHDVLAEAEKRPEELWSDEWVHRVTAHFAKLVPSMKCFLPAAAL